MCAASSHVRSRTLGPVRYSTGDIRRAILAVYMRDQSKKYDAFSERESRAGAAVYADTPKTDCLTAIVRFVFTICIL